MGVWNAGRNMKPDSVETLAGGAAYSEFHLSRLLVKLKRACSDITAVYAEYVHLLELNGVLDDIHFNQAKQLLSYAPRRTSPEHKGDLFCTVVPRPGTISPWSSKATDIFRICGLDTVHRVERGLRWYLRVASGNKISQRERQALAVVLHDRMTETVLFEEEFTHLFEAGKARPYETVALQSGARRALEIADKKLGLALNSEEIDYLLAAYSDLGRDPSDVELMMFAQANSEHCRHKIFNARWQINREPQPLSLFDMIRNTYRVTHGRGVLSAYSDNAAVIEGAEVERFVRDPTDRSYRYRRQNLPILMKVETHNHPTAIAPLPGAATGSGGEIRDEGAVGRGSSPKAGLCGFSTSHLNIEGYSQPWELATGKPERIVSALEIMLEGPIGGAAFNNEFGRPALTGYFRTFEYQPEANRPGSGGASGTAQAPEFSDAAGVSDNICEVRGYHKPVMVAGGVGMVQPEHVVSLPLKPGNLLIVLGGPAMLIGLGGGAASSMASGESHSDLDFASVQRGNAEMQRRCQEVIDGCRALGEENPIRLIHDVGAGGLSNALPELVKDGGVGGIFELRDIPTAEPGMTPLEIWCNEAQERYVLAIDAAALETFRSLCLRERCPFALVGEATAELDLVLKDSVFANKPVDIPLDLLFGQVPQTQIAVERVARATRAQDLAGVELVEAVERVLRYPAVAAKHFLITIGDRSITGMVARDQMVGPWQVPVADVAVTLAGFKTLAGEAMAMGERSPVAVLNSSSAARLAVSEAITNLAAAQVGDLSKVVLSANWMAAAGRPGEDEALFDAVRAVGMELCPELGIAVPVGKDSLSMHTEWQTSQGRRCVTSPVTLIVSAFAPVINARRTLTPELKHPVEPTELLLIDLGRGKNRLGGSCLLQTYQQMGSECPDLDDPQLLLSFFAAIQQLLSDDLILAYHDRSDGGLLVTLLEMAFAGRCGLAIDLESTLRSSLKPDHIPSALAVLFAEELGAVIQVTRGHQSRVMEYLQGAGLGGCISHLGCPDPSGAIVFRRAGHEIFRSDRIHLQQSWSELSFRMQMLRDDPDCAREEFESIASDDPGLSCHLSFDLEDDFVGPMIRGNSRPMLAVLREEGVNSHNEMAAAFERAGFQPVDVHMSDLIEHRLDLKDFQAMVACGGFSYGDVLGGGGGWAKSILLHEDVRALFEDYFASDSLTLGVCNGCQMLALLKEVIPGAEFWPRFVGNRSEQFEARTTLVRVAENASPWLVQMQNSVMPIAVAHGEGLAEFASAEDLAHLKRQRQVALQFVDNHHHVTEHYPSNPNGSDQGLAGMTSADGRVLIMMPHPERVFRTVQNSWHPDHWQEDGPWMKLFRNARQAFG